MTGNYKCPVCHSKADQCSCLAICKVCLKKGNYEAAGSGECDCCKVCKKPSSDYCDCCKVCLKKKNECKCQEKISKTTRVAKNPPSIKTLIDQGKDYLPSYLSALKRWSRTCGIAPEDQADEILLMVSEQAPAIYRKMDVHFGDDLAGDKEGMTKLTEWFQKEYGLTKSSDLMRLFNVFIGTQRKKNEDISKYVTAFDSAYNNLKKLGESVSPNLLSMLLLTHANLSDVDMQLITKSLEFDTTNKTIQAAIYENTKEAMRKHQSMKLTNSNSASAVTKQTFLADLVEVDSSLETFAPEELEEALQSVLLAKKQQSERGGGGRNFGGGKKKVWKCWKCLCDHPLKVACTCPCTLHKHWECPKPNEKYYKRMAEREKEKEKETQRAAQKSPQSHRQQESTSKTSWLTYIQSARGNATFMAKTVTGVSRGEKQPITTLKKELASVNEVFVTAKSATEHQHVMVIDSASPGTIVSLNVFKQIRDSYPASVRSLFSYEESDQVYQFGGKDAQCSASMGLVHFPLYIQDTEDNFHEIWAKVDVLKIDDVPFLLGGRSLRSVGAVWNFQESTIAFKTRTESEERSAFYVKQAESDHFLLPFLPPTKEDGQRIWRQNVEAGAWSRDAQRTLVSFALHEEDAAPEHIMDQSVESVHTFLTDRKHYKDQQPLSQKEIIKLHHFFGHCSRDRLRDLIKNANRMGPDTERHLDLVKDCEVCKVESSKRPKPKVSMPRSTNFNHVVAIDLKENKRFASKAPPYILYIVDLFSRFKAGVFVRSKQGPVIVEALLHQWIKFFGPMTYLQVDRGSEWLNSVMKEFCTQHNIRLTTTPSYTPNANGCVEKNHHVLDRMLERMTTADPTLKPQDALCWALQASNTLDLVKGISPFILVFGRPPMFPSLMEYTPGSEEPNISETVAQQHKTMLLARQAWVELEADKSIKKALQERLYSQWDSVAAGDWVYFKTSKFRRFQGPAKVVLRDSKKLHCINHGQPITLNLDDVLFWKPEDMEDRIGEELVSLPAKFQPRTADTAKSVSWTDQSAGGPDVNKQDTSTSQPDPATDSLDIEIVPATQSITENSTPDSIPATSTDIGVPMECKFCYTKMSSKVVVEHCEEEHQVKRGNIRNLAQMCNQEEDSVYSNVDKLASDVVISSDDGRYLVLKEKIADGWTAQDIATREHINLHTIKDIANMRFVGPLESETEKGFYVTNCAEQIFLVNSEADSINKLGEDDLEVPSKVFVVNIPRSRHGEERCRRAKEKELQDYKTFNVYDVVDMPSGAHMINTEWVLVEKEDIHGVKTVKARLCMRGDQELDRHLISTDSPTAKTMTLKIILTLATSEGWKINVKDIRRAFLQSVKPSRTVLVRPPREASVPSGKVWSLNVVAYGLNDASRAFYLRQAEELKKINFTPLTMDPATFVYRDEKEGIIKAAYVTHVDDALTAGEEEIVDQAHDKMSHCLEYGEVQELPFRFLGSNYNRDSDGLLLVDQDHYLKELSVPDLDLSHLTKHETLAPEQQTTFRSITSKINVIAMTSRPDLVFRAKKLTTRYGRATKADILMATKLLKSLKTESTQHVIPNVGSITDTVLVGICDASTRSADTVFSTGAHVILLVNKHTKAASVINYQSKKIDRVVTSSFAAEALAMEKMVDMMYLARRLLDQILGPVADSIKGLVLTDNDDLFSAVHHLKGCKDNRLMTDIIYLRQSITEDKTFQELRFIHSKTNVSDCMTKSKPGGTGEDLLKILRSGVYQIPGGSEIRDSTLTSVRTWEQLMCAEGIQKRRK